MPFFYDFQSYLIFVVPALIISIIAQVMVSRIFSKYSTVKTSRGYTGAQAARNILDKNGLTNVRIEHIKGNLTDHFDPRTNVVRLSDSVYNSTSVAAVGVAAHEVGHAIQYARNYAPMKIRGAIIPATQFGSGLSIPLVLAGIFLSVPVLITAGILLFCFVVLFQLITLPVEFNASGRAIKTLESEGMLSDTELKGSKKVLSAAAMTYVAALITSIAQLLRLLSIANRRR